MNSSELIASIKNTIENTTNIKTVFGEPYSVAKDTLIIPVSSIKVAGGGGGGSGTGKRNDSESAEEVGNGSGVGLGLKITTMPLGYIEVKDGMARFITITDTTKIVLGGLVTLGLALLTVSRAMRWRAKRSG